MSDTIVACATPTGYSSIAVVRLSGDEAIGLLKKVFISSQDISVFQSGHMYYGRMIDPSNQDTIDNVLTAIFYAPNSYTGENVVEISCHGNPLIVDRIIRVLIALGARLAQPGEFTRRAFLNNKIDLVQAEAVLDAIFARCDTTRKLAIYQLEGRLSSFLEELRTQLITLLTKIEASIDFPEEDETQFDIVGFKTEINEIQEKILRLLEGAEQGTKLKQGYKVVIVGRPNVGKSTLFNRLLSYERAIVHETPGTTRDYIEEEVEIDGILTRLIDTAGIFLDSGGPDSIASKRSEELIQTADLILLVFDGAEAMNEQDTYLYELVHNQNNIFIINKIDLNIALKESEILGDAIKISAKNGDNIAVLKKTIKEHLFPQKYNDNILLTRRRHIEALKDLERCLTNVRESKTLETIAFELHNALDIIGELTGKVFREDILNRIFEEFCIGK
ncbi:MAG: tRNA uridine-5-carboxymethylaminomethyl(34) synthesis GTPase MnmE [Rubrivivax sp.]|nr:tRNA uridine-5-carboxymethylaminomethyl(34) synthesis GTPase MnmE [Rubrivivax sp.]